MTKRAKGTMKFIEIPLSMGNQKFRNWNITLPCLLPCHLKTFNLQKKTYKRNGNYKINAIIVSRERKVSSGLLRTPASIIYIWPQTLSHTTDSWDQFARFTYVHRTAALSQCLLRTGLVAFSLCADELFEYAHCGVTKFTSLQNTERLHSHRS